MKTFCNLWQRLNAIAETEAPATARTERRINKIYRNMKNCFSGKSFKEDLTHRQSESCEVLLCLLLLFLGIEVRQEAEIQIHITNLIKIRLEESGSPFYINRE